MYRRVHSFDNQIAINIEMLGATNKKSEMVIIKLYKKAITAHMRESMRDLNLKAIQLGNNFV